MLNNSPYILLTNAQLHTIFHIIDFSLFTLKGFRFWVLGVRESTLYDLRLAPQTLIPAFSNSHIFKFSNSPVTSHQSPITLKGFRFWVLGVRESKMSDLLFIFKFSNSQIFKFSNSPITLKGFRFWVLGVRETKIYEGRFTIGFSKSIPKNLIPKFSNYLIFKFSNFHIFTFSNSYIFKSSNSYIYTSAHLHIFKFSNSHIFKFSNSLITNHLSLFSIHASTPLFTFHLLKFRHFSSGYNPLLPSAAKVQVDAVTSSQLLFLKKVHNFV